MGTLRWMIVVPGLVLFGAAISSCREGRTNHSSNATASAASPLEAARWINRLHEQREYGQIASLIAEKDRASTIRLLIALDEAIGANSDLRRTAESAYSGPQGEYWDLAAMANNIGIFSRDVSFINVNYRGDEAIVTLQEGDTLPLVHADFVMKDGRWYYQPEPTPEQLPAELNKLASLIRTVEGEVARGASLNAYVDAFFYRVVPQMRRVALAGVREKPLMTASTPDPE